ncbi:MAG: LysR family transcriptional regulator [Casimicrobiaceae bacterium]|nr:LysR family transcriptional regulator [Casimicrobiaceae bacterium]MCX8097472.1 LysR family transcriptional regulator [Casimicrobiaceae bacterium]MDW8311190.1 LysR family transcriptional regulator [Burkholderiales bacterium]
MPALSLAALELLDAIAREGSFARAAARLGRAPSAVTYAVRKLEEELDVLLFDRRGYRATLTPAGRLLVERGRLLLDDAARLTELVRQAERGWEPTLRIALDAILPFEWLIEHLAAWDRAGCPTELRLSRETLGGSWDALADDRADLAIGAAGDPPPAHAIAIQPLFRAEFVFAVAPQHPLARAREPIGAAELLAHRAIVVADSSRRLPARSSGLVPGQPTLVVPTMEAKLELQRRGFGVGYLPRWTAAPLIAQGELIERRIEEPKPAVDLVVGWRLARRGPQPGKALAWWRERLRSARAPEPGPQSSA